MAVKGLMVGRSALVVDDERFTRALVARLLGYMGATDVHQAEDGGVALDMLENDHLGVDCIIADLEMPRVNGLDMLRAIRSGANRSRRDVPVVMLTSHSDTDLVGIALGLDVNGFIVKPVSQKALQDRLSRILSEPERQVTRPPGDYAKVGRREPPRPRQEATLQPPPGVLELALPDVPVGAVLARDLVLSSKVILIPTATTLNRRLLDRLAELAELGVATSQVWVRADTVPPGTTGTTRPG